jgi:hypothetical protein
MSDANKNYLKGRIIALETEVAFLKGEVERWKEAYDDAHAVLQADTAEEPRK